MFKQTKQGLLETLEQKILMTGAAPWGINLDGNVDWGSGVWVDVTRTFRRWGAQYMDNPFADEMNSPVAVSTSS